MDPSFAVWADVGVAIMPTTSIDAKNNDDFIAILPYTWFPQFLLTRQKSSLCAGAHSRSAAIEQTRKDRSEVDARRRHVRCPQKGISKRGVRLAQIGSSPENLRHLQHGING
jgi:hypothetical protein